MDDENIHETAVSFNKLIEGTEVPEGATIHGLDWGTEALMIEWSLD